jgi:hypothetical protein
VTRPAGVLDGVIEEVGRHEPQSGGIDAASHTSPGSSSTATPFSSRRSGSSTVSASSPAGRWRPVQPHHAGVRFRHVEHDPEHVEDAVRFLDAVGEGFPRGGGVRRVAQGEFGDPAEPGERGTEVVRDVVEGFAHAADQGLVAFEEPVDKARQLGELVVRGSDRDTRLEIAGAENGTGGGHDLAQGPGGAVRQEGAAEMPRRRRGSPRRRPRGTVAGVATSVTCPTPASCRPPAAGGKTRSRSASRGTRTRPDGTSSATPRISLSPAIPGRRHQTDAPADVEGTIECAPGPGTAPTLVEAAEPAVSIDCGVLQELGGDDLEVLLADRGEEQGVGQEKQDRRAGDEDRRVPEIQADRQRPPGALKRA